MNFLFVWFKYPKYKILHPLHIRDFFTTGPIRTRWVLFISKEAKISLNRKKRSQYTGSILKITCTKKKERIRWIPSAVMTDSNKRKIQKAHMR